MKKTLIIASLAIIISLGSVYSLSAWQGEKLNRQNREEIKEELHLAVVNQDYNTWLDLKTDRTPCANKDLINDENFTLFSEAHQLLRDGYVQEAKEIFHSLGKEVPEKRMGRVGSYMSEGQKPHKGRNFRAPWGENLNNQ